MGEEKSHKQVITENISGREVRNGITVQNNWALGTTMK
jgi:hypothetical protein